MRRSDSADQRPLPQPTRRGDPVELRLALAAVRLVLLLAVPTLVVAWLAAGASGVLSAGVGIAVLLAMYLLSGGLLSFAARFGPPALMAAALGGFALRLALYATVILALREVEIIHGPTLGISTAVLLVTSLIYEAWLATRTPGLFWVDAQAGRTTTERTTA